MSNLPHPYVRIARMAAADVYKDIDDAYARAIAAGLVDDDTTMKVALRAVHFAVAGASVQQDLDAGRKPDLAEIRAFLKPKEGNQ